MVAVNSGTLVGAQVYDTTYDPLSVCCEIMKNHTGSQITVTGYGRHLFKKNWPAAVVITEIKAASIGAKKTMPSCRTIIDIGGQDTKAVALDQKGSVMKFAMNDRCAAGTGRFLEVMATALSFTREEFIASGETASQGKSLSSMCTVFAESEIVSLVARGADRGEIARGIHQSIAKRTAALAKTIRVEPDLLFIGGGALNTLLTPLLEKRMKLQIHVPEDPQTVTALGAALFPS